MTVSLLHNGATAIEAMDVALDMDADGASLTMVLKRHVKTALGIARNDLVELTVSGTRCFYGFVDELDQDFVKKCWRVRCVDIQGKMKQLMYHGRTLQYNDTDRQAEVMWARDEWTVGAIIQDILYNMQGDVDSDMPGFSEVIPAAVLSGWQYDDYATWQSDPDTWKDAVSESSPWEGLDRKVYGYRVSGASVFDAINNLLRRYYPARRWYVDPVTLEPKPAAPYTDSTATVDCSSASVKACLENVAEVTEQHYTRVIVRGQHTLVGTPAASGSASQFVNYDYPFKQRVSTLYHFYLSGETTVRCTMTTSTVTGIDRDSGAFIVQSTVADVFAYQTPDPDPPSDFTVVAQAGEYGYDTGWTYDTGYMEGATVQRTLTIIDKGVGDRVLVISPTDGSASFQDRSADGQALAAEVWAALKTTRYTGKLRYKAAPTILPVQRIELTNHPEGSLIFLPQRLSWSMKTGLVDVTLGDDRYNPVEELAMLRQIKYESSTGER